MYGDDGPGTRLDTDDIPLPFLAAKWLSELTTPPALKLLLTERCKKCSDKDSDL